DNSRAAANRRHRPILPLTGSARGTASMTANTTGAMAIAVSAPPRLPEMSGQAPITTAPPVSHRGLRPGLRAPSRLARLAAWADTKANPAHTGQSRLKYSAALFRLAYGPKWAFPLGL